jgi:hypothetical protein
MLALIRLQEYLHFKAHQQHEVISVPPFTLFLHATDTSSAATYALPDASGSCNDLQESFARLQTIFAGHDRIPTYNGGGKLDRSMRYNSRKETSTRKEENRGQFTQEI